MVGNWHLVTTIEGEEIVNLGNVLSIYPRDNSIICLGSETTTLTFRNEAQRDSEFEKLKSRLLKRNEND